MSSFFPDKQSVLFDFLQNRFLTHGVKMKKVMTLGAVFVLSLSTVVEAKRGGSGISRSTPMVQKKSTQQAQSQPKQADADFNSTPKQTASTAQQPQGNRLANFATGAMAGYLLSEALSPSEAQAQTAQSEAQKLTQQVAQTAPVMPTVPSFKAIDPKDPFLIEKTAGYLRYCLNGVQYLVSTANTQLPPTLMVDRTNAPAQCVITP